MLERANILIDTMSNPIWHQCASNFDSFTKAHDEAAWDGPAHLEHYSSVSQTGFGNLTLISFTSFSGSLFFLFFFGLHFIFLFLLFIVTDSFSLSYLFSFFVFVFLFPSFRKMFKIPIFVHDFRNCSQLPKYVCTFQNCSHF